MLRHGRILEAGLGLGFAYACSSRPGWVVHVEAKRSFFLLLFQVQGCCGPSGIPSVIISTSIVRVCFAELRWNRLVMFRFQFGIQIRSGNGGRPPLPSRRPAPARSRAQGSDGGTPTARRIVPSRAPSHCRLLGGRSSTSASV